MVVDGLDEAPSEVRQGIAKVMKDLTAAPLMTGDCSTKANVKAIPTSRADFEIGKNLADEVAQFHLVGGLKDDLSSWITASMERSPRIQQLREAYGDIVQELRSELINRSGT